MNQVHQRKVEIEEQEMLLYFERKKAEEERRLQQKREKLLIPLARKWLTMVVLAKKMKCWTYALDVFCNYFLIFTNS